MKLCLNILVTCSLVFFGGVGTTSAQVLPTNLFQLTKLHDFSNSPGGAMQPWAAAHQIGNDMWFTTSSGGDNGFGAIGRWSFATNSFHTEFAAFNNTNGNTPQNKLGIDGTLAYLTTTRGGTGDRGVLARFDLTDPVNTYTVLVNSLSNSPVENPNTFQGNPVVVDRGTHKEVYFLTRNGGLGGASWGTVQKFNTTTQTTSLVANLPGGVDDGRNPIDGGMTRVGNSLYFTTFSGGPTGTGNPLGTGALMRVDLTTDSLTTLATMPTLVPNTRSPSNAPAYDPITNALYFTTVGTNPNPGSLMKFDLTLQSLTTLTSLADGPSSGANLEGRQVYGEVVIHDGFAYFSGQSGGDFNGGTLIRFNLSTNTIAQIWHLGNDTNLGINWGSALRGGPSVASYNGQDYLFVMPRQGGADGQGTILVMAIPEPSTFLLVAAAFLLVLWRRRMAES